MLFFIYYCEVCSLLKNEEKEHVIVSFIYDDFYKNKEDSERVKLRCKCREMKHYEWDNCEEQENEHKHKKKYGYSRFQKESEGKIEIASLNANV